MLRTLFVAFILLRRGDCSGFIQERARVLYVNNKYIAHASVFTYRENRRSPYLTSANVTLADDMGNNFTFVFEFINKQFSNLPLRLEFKTCDGMKQKWVKEFLETYTDLSSECPVKMGAYHFNKLTLPPANIPLPITSQDYITKMFVYVTKTKERVIEISGILKSAKKL